MEVSYDEYGVGLAPTSFATTDGGAKACRNRLLSGGGKNRVGEQGSVWLATVL